MLKRLAVRIYIPEGISKEAFPAQRVRHPGYPVRSEIRHIRKQRRGNNWGITVKNRLLVIIGGSQGAAALNRWVVEHLEVLRGMAVSVYCVTGLGKAPEGVSGEAGPDRWAKFVSFSDQMGAVISAADLIISRAGAGSIAEITRCRTPAILIPYPHAADNHQQANAQMPCAAWSRNRSQRR